MWAPGGNTAPHGKASAALPTKTELGPSPSPSPPHMAVLGPGWQNQPPASTFGK